MTGDIIFVVMVVAYLACGWHLHRIRVRTMLRASRRCKSCDGYGGPCYDHNPDWVIGTALLWPLIGGRILAERDHQDHLDMTTLIYGKPQEDK